MELLNKAKRTKETAFAIGQLSTQKKNDVLEKVADHIKKHTEEILAANEIDVAKAKEKGVKASLVDRLLLTEERVQGAADGLIEIVALADPVGETLEEKLRPNGLRIGKRRVPIGSIGIIYESRPNVTIDAFGLCFKTGNAVLLKGGSEALESNKAIVKVIQEALALEGVEKEALQLIEDTNRETTVKMMKLTEYLDLLIPRGGGALIRAVVENATVPVIETGVGNCHLYVDEDVDLDMALAIADNGKTQRMGVCNALESLVIHEKVLTPFLDKLVPLFKEKGIEIRGDKEAQKISDVILAATPEDFGTEYLDAIISVKTVKSIDEAINHINTYGTKHSEAIVTNSYLNAERFLNEVDAAAVYVNASTRFTDGSEFGFGAEIGISTQKLHARGPMGLTELTTTKYTVRGTGQIRP